MKPIICFLFLAFIFEAYAYDKLYLKGNLKDKSAARPLSFGLSTNQQKDIYKLTDGEIDFQNYFLISSTSNKNFPGIQVEYFTSNHLPPSVLTEYDPKTELGWWQQALKVQEAWAMATGKGITIADCDAGYYHNEDDLSANLLMEYAYDLSDRDNPTVINDGNFAYHGTAVAAMMVGILDGKGINGVSYNSRLVPLQNFNYAPNDDLDKEEATVACILHAMKIPDVKIIVLENQTATGSSETFSGTREAVTLALKAGFTIVSAAGNSNKELTTEAANDTGSIIVGAVVKENSKADFSNYGTRITVAAYGRDLLTLGGPNGSLTNFGGTSGATPQVASTVALMLEVNPHLSPLQVRDILVKTRITNDKNQTVGGLLDLVEAVKMARDFETAPDLEAMSFRAQLLQILN